ncbi:MAG: copper oxidase [Candidatus Eremiobacteraeota bacterium]|nr:copper oxidase [Candidatus Eremiobacteraeota bacterium]
MEDKVRVSTPEIVAITGLSVLMLAAGVLVAAQFGDFAMRGQPRTATAFSSRPMPAGMVMSGQQSTQQMNGMAAVDRAQIKKFARDDERGGRTLAPQMDHGVKVFRLEAGLVSWHILSDTAVGAYAYNGQVPGPLIRIRQGDRVRVVLTNHLQEPTSIHWHGLVLPNAMDGVPPLTQKAVPPGGTFTYEFTGTQSGTYFYHSHVNSDRQQALGLYGALIVDPRKSVVGYDKEVTVELGEWTVRDGKTYPSMPMEGLMPNFFTINGKAYPSTETINLKVGQKLLVRFIGTNSGFVHPMHIHGGPFRVVATDGNPIPVSAQVLKDTLQVAPGERYDVVWPARLKGHWLLHCHINHHITNDGAEIDGAGGLTEVINVE